ncbi:pro-Pol polyprotein [Nephila pilipes]|uniref:Pro-Pol polyprotein n=1 Tax=Nephila pilipes TaxID=299642 RepID=A0A8X6PF44_NEPPI|nr:pro-Pol polyprotein [Nephila pilipes]
MTAEITARTLMHGWISRFGCSVTITTDQSTHFLSNLFRKLTRMLGCKKIQIAAYHPQANGIIERHRHLISALKAHNQIKWTEILLIALLGLRLRSRWTLRLPVHNLFLVLPYDPPPSLGKWFKPQLYLCH